MSIVIRYEGQKRGTRYESEGPEHRAILEAEYTPFRTYALDTPRRLIIHHRDRDGRRIAVTNETFVV